ncbi:hypothetical protein [Pseudomonas sp. UM16]|uniref:hypothetical protein n=1 Tax=Pseudomonas sp. UM16 TaxID=3158962 RepID=UPI00398FF9FB
MSNKEDPMSAMGNLIGNHFGSLYVLAMHQTRAIMELSSALSKEPNISPETKAKALYTLELCDEMIGQIEEGVGEHAKKDVKGFFNGE